MRKQGNLAQMKQYRLKVSCKVWGSTCNVLNNTGSNSALLVTEPLENVILTNLVFLTLDILDSMVFVNELWKQILILVQKLYFQFEHLFRGILFNLIKMFNVQKTQ